MDGRQWKAIIQAMAGAVNGQSEYLSSLDATVGDGDHGVNLARALHEAAQQVADLEDPTPAAVLRATGRAVLNTMGGVSGALFGSFFLGGSRALPAKAALTLYDLAAMFAAGLAEVQQRGKAQPGDKTMVDALAPAVAALQTAAEANLPLKEALLRAAEAARGGAEATRDMVARYGRARFLGERSLGYQDAGATSMAVMLAALADEVGD